MTWMPFCPNGHPSEGMAFCRQCGAAIPDAFSDSTPPTTAPIGATCANGHVIAPGDRFCSVCGGTAVPGVAGVAADAPASPVPVLAPRTCPNGHELEGTASFCGICGTSVDPNVPPPPPADPAAGWAPPSGQPVSGPIVSPSMAAQRTSPLAIIGLVLGIFGFCCFLPAVAGLILGILGLRQTNEPGYKGRGLAIAAIVVSAVSLSSGAILFGFNLIDLHFHVNSNNLVDALLSTIRA